MMKLKDKKIELLRPTFQKDAEGFGAETLVPIAPSLWAYFRQLSGKEIFANATTVLTEQVLFVVNWREGLDTQLVVRFRGVMYDVTRVDVFEGYKGEVNIPLTQIMILPQLPKVGGDRVLLHISLYIPHEIIVNNNLSRVNAACRYRDVVYQFNSRGTV